jgi:putative membrane protein
MIFGGIWMVLFWGFIIALFVWGIRTLAKRDEPSSKRIERTDPLDVAKTRYAKGEISREEFEQIKKDLS